MKKKQFLALALSAVMAGGMLAGCGSSNGSSSSSKSDAKDEVVTLKWIQVGNGMPKDYDEWLARGVTGITEEALSQTPASTSISCSPTRTVTLLR